MPIYSYDRYSADGSTTQFNITVDYLSSAHLEVHLDGVKQTSGFTIDTSTNKVTFTSAPGSGVIVLIKRVTPKTKAEYQAQIADFTNGSVLTDTDLDNAVLGLLYITQEAEDAGASNAISKDLTDNLWDADSTRIKSVGTPTDTLDAVTKQYVDGLSLYDSPAASQKWTFSGDGSTTAFTLADPAPLATDVNMYIIDVAGVLQKPTTNFTISGTTLTFGSAPASGTNNITVRNFGVARDILAQPIKSDATDAVAMSVKAITSQSADLQQWQNTSGTALAKVAIDGDATFVDVNATGNADVDGNLNVDGTLTVDGTSTLTGAATLGGTAAITGATTLTGGVAGNLNILTGALQFAGNTGMTIRQVVTSSTTGSEPTVTSPTNDTTTGHFISITPQTSGSKILVLGSMQCNMKPDSTPAYAGVRVNLYTHTSQQTVNTTAAGTPLLAGADAGPLFRIRESDTTSVHYVVYPLLYVYEPGDTTTRYLDFTINCDNEETEEVSHDRSLSPFYAIELA